MFICHWEVQYYLQLIYMYDLIYRKYTTSWVLEASQTKLIISIFSANMQHSNLGGIILKSQNKGD